MWLILKSILGSRNHYHSYFKDGEAETWESKIHYRLDKGPLVGLPRWPAVKKMPANARTTRDAGLIPGSGGFPGGGYGNLLQHFIPGKFPGQRSLAAYSSWGRKESGMTAHTHTHTPLVGSKAKIWTKPGDIRILPCQLLCCCSVTNCGWLPGTPWTAARQASPSSTISQSLLKFVSTE